MIIFLIYLLSIGLSWGLIKLGLELYSDLKPAPFWVVVYMFIPILNLISALVVSIVSLFFFIKNRGYFLDEKMINKILSFFKFN
jgi:hypothetical protein